MSEETQAPEQSMAEIMGETSTGTTATPETTKTEPETPAEVTAEPGKQEPVKEEPQGFQKRINKLTAEKYSERARAEAAELELQRLKSEKLPVSDEVPPQLADFDYDENKFLDAKIDYQMRLRLEKSAQENYQRQSQYTRQQASEEFAKKVESAGIEDYSETIENMVKTISVPPYIVDAIQQDTHGPELAYYLGKNLETATKISEMPPIQAAMELGRISAALSNKKQQKPITKTPAPVPAIGRGSASSGKSYEEMSMDELMAT